MKIVTLCGSLKFQNEMMKIAQDMALEGYCILAPVYLTSNVINITAEQLLKLKEEHVERSFADSKQNHGYRYAMYKGVKKNQHYTWLICAAQNMKNISIKNDNVGKKPLTLSSNTHNFIKTLKNIIKILFIRKPLEKI